ncbi:hypothetical protein R0381_000685 [Jeongeupia wiesaeckerbachi]|uniref:hypothetical protein n=1 Tax=Jeongeupia wiesaeckerbachi TaxID=3051218 RepID=UPI003D801AC3
MYAQIMRFRLKDADSRAAFVELTRQMHRWLQPGFTAYELYEGAKGWLDRIAWSDRAACERGLDDFLATGIARQMLALVDDDVDVFFGRHVIASAPG